jgi:hypothetical protein
MKRTEVDSLIARAHKACEAAAGVRRERQVQASNEMERRIEREEAEARLRILAADVSVVNGP